MKTALFTTLISLISLASQAQCSYNTIPSAPGNLAVSISRPHTDPHLNWGTVSDACEYIVNAKLITKQGQTYTEQQAAGYPFLVPQNPSFSQQDCWDVIARSLAATIKGTITLKYEVSARNNMGVSVPIKSGYYRIND